MMLSYFLITVIILSNAANSILSKRFQLSVKNDFSTMLYLNLINAAFGTVYFLFICKFRIQMNVVTLMYSLLYAAIVVNSVIVSVVALSKMSMPVYSIIYLTGSVFGSAFFGRMFFDEKITLYTALAMVCLFLAVIIPFLGSKEIKYGKKSFLVMLWTFVLSAVSSVVLKFYTSNPNTYHANNMFFMTNANCLVICAGYIAAIRIIAKKKSEFSLVALNGKQIANIGFRTAVSNIGSILSVLVIAEMDISLYTIITSSLGLVASALISRFMFCENMGCKNYISIFLALVAIVLTAI